MADIKISALSALTGANTATDDLYVVVDVNVPETKKQTRAELFQNVPAASFAGANVFNDAGADVDQRIEGDTDANLVFVDASTDRVGIGTATPTAKLQVNGSFALAAPVTVTTDYTVAAGVTFIISNRGSSNTITLPAVATSAGRILKVQTRTAQTVVSATSNVTQKAGGTLSSILPATIGAWAELVCDGSTWIIVAAGTIP
jgi:hypothetical protein